MNKMSIAVFLHSLQEDAYSRATTWLGNEASYFGFYLEFDSLANQMVSMNKQKALEFSRAWLEGLVQLRETTDARLEMCVARLNSCEKIMQALPTPTASSEEISQMHKVMLRMHPTVLQQASILAFRIIDLTVDVSDTDLPFDWYKMPLI